MKSTTLLPIEFERPPKGTPYWYIGFNYHDDFFAGDPRPTIWLDCQMDENRIKLGNFFSSEEDAVKWRDELYKKAKLRFQK